MEKICMKGVGGVHYVTMHAKAGVEYEKGMAVTLTGENEVGLGAAGGSPVFGVLSTVEKTMHGQVTVGVQVSGFNDEVKMAEAAAKVPGIGSVPACNDKGELVKADSAPAAGKGIVTAVDTAAHKATIKI